MENRRLQAFVTLAEQGSYHAAADALCITQPALSKQIQALEHDLNLVLFTRGRHGATLTPQGKLFYPEACEFLVRYRELRKFAGDIKRGATAKLALGFGLSTYSLTPQWINTFQARFPDVTVSLNNIPSSVQCRMLLEGALHIGFLRLPVLPPLSHFVIKQERLVLAVPANASVKEGLHHLVEHYPLLRLRTHAAPCLAEQVRIILAEQFPDVHAVSVSDDMHSLLALIGGGNGIAFLPESICNVLPAGVKMVELANVKVGWEIAMAWDPTREHEGRDNFLRMVMEMKP